MTPFSNTSVLLIDRSGSWAVDLRSKLAPLGIQVHVVSTPRAALRVCDCKKIEAAVVEYALDQSTADLSAALKKRCIPTIYTPTTGISAIPHARPQLPMEGSF